MTNYILLILFLLPFYSNICTAQSKKKIKKNQVSSKTEWQSAVNNKGKESSYKSAYLRYDKRGNILEEIIYNPDGTVKKVEIFKYNSNGDKVEATRYNPDKSIKRRTVYKYNENGLWTERIVYDGKGNIKEKEKRVFEYYE